MESKLNNQNRISDRIDIDIEDEIEGDENNIIEEEEGDDDDDSAEFEEADDDFVVPFSVFQQNKLSELKTEIPEIKPVTKVIMKKKKKKSKKAKKIKNHDKYPQAWDGPHPNCAWDGPGGCDDDSEDYYEDDEEEKDSPVVIEKSRFSNLFSKRLESQNDITENFLHNDIDDEEKKGFDKTKLLPGKTIKDRIKEHLRKKELERKKQSKSFQSTSIRPGIIQKPTTSKILQSIKPRVGKKQTIIKPKKKKSPETQTEGFQIYSVEEWLKMG